jgi:FdhD protein
MAGVGRVNQKTSIQQADLGVEISENQIANGSVKPASYISISAGSVVPVAGEIVNESLVCISVNGQELATFMCSPTALDQMALGFLYNEQFISDMSDVRSIHISKGDTCVDVWLNNANFEVPERRIITAGCGGGITFDDLSEQHDPLLSTRSTTPEILADLMKQTHLGAGLYHRARGIHTASLADGESLLLQVEDIGRHNCLDKLAGAALLKGMSSKDLILFSSGRISSEMINKARRLQTPIVCSRTSPTALSVALADAWNISIVAYVRQNRMRVYTHPERIEGAQA